jgi:uncharacterized protein (DUF4415 family)
MPKRLPADDDNYPELTDAMWANATVLDESPAAHLMKRRGRPTLAQTKVMLSLRVDKDVLDRYRATGRGWQGRVRALLAANAPRKKRQAKTAA